MGRKFGKMVNGEVEGQQRRELVGSGWRHEPDLRVVGQGQCGGAQSGGESEIEETCSHDYTDVCA